MTYKYTHRILGGQEDCLKRPKVQKLHSECIIVNSIVKQEYAMRIGLVFTESIDATREHIHNIYLDFMKHRENGNFDSTAPAVRLFT